MKNPLETPCSRLVSQCLVQILSHKESTIIELTEKVKSNKIFSEKCTNIEEVLSSGTSKKRKLDIEWSWITVIQQINNQKDNCLRITWSLVVNQLLKNCFAQIPECILLAIIEYAVYRIESVNTDLKPTSDRKSIHSLIQAESTPIQDIYFKIFVNILYQSSSQLISKFDLSIINASLNKMANHLLISVTHQKTSHISRIFSHIIRLHESNPSLNLDMTFYKNLIFKFDTMLRTVNVIQINLDFLDLMLKVFNMKQVNKALLTFDFKSSLIEHILMSFKKLTDSDKGEDPNPHDTDEESFEVYSQHKPKPANRILLYSQFSNLNKAQHLNYLYVSNILMNLIGLEIYFDPNEYQNSDKIESLFVFSLKQLPEKSLTDKLDKYYSFPNAYSKLELIKAVSDNTTNLIDIKLLKLISNKLMERAQVLFQLNEFNLAQSIPIELVQILIEEYFLNLEILTCLIQVSPENSRLKQIDINSMLKCLKNLFGLICSFTKRLVTADGLDVGAIERLGFIVTEFYLSVRNSISKSSLKMFLFLFSIDMNFFEICHQILLLNSEANSLTDQQANNSVNICLKNVLNEAHFSIGDFNCCTSLERLQLVCLAFICQMAVECLSIDLNSVKKYAILNEKNDLKQINAEFNSFGENLKNNMFNFIFEKYFKSEKKNDGLALRQEVLLKIDSARFNQITLILFLRSFQKMECSVLKFDEFMFCLNLVESLFKHNYFELSNDPFMSLTILKILTEYSKFILMTSACFTWLLAVSLSSSFNDSAYQSCKKKFICLVDFIHSNIYEQYFHSIDCQLEMCKLIGQTLKLNRLEIVHSNVKQSLEASNQAEIKKYKKDSCKKMNENFGKILSFLDSKSNKLKLEIHAVLLESSFDRYLLRKYLFKYLEHEKTMSISLFEDEPDKLRQILQNPFYLDCLNKLAHTDCILVENCHLKSCLINDEFENLFFDKFYKNQMEKYQIFETDKVGFIQIIFY